jgi:hypothetical protein
MRRVALLALLVMIPYGAYAQQTVMCVNSYAGTQTRTYTLPPNTLQPGPNQYGRIGPDAASAAGDIGKTFFTLEMTSFNDANCGGNACRNDIPGIAHRTWPKGSCVAVCRAQTDLCKLAVVMDYGPNTRLGCRTIDANPALQSELRMNPNDTVPATYQLISLPGTKCDVDITGVGITQVGNIGQVQTTYSASPLSSYPGVSTYPGIGTGAQPMQQPIMQQQPLQQQSSTQSQVPVSSLLQNTGTTATGPTTGTNIAQDTGTNGPVAMLLFAQKTTVTRSMPISVSWGAVGAVLTCTLGMGTDDTSLQRIATGKSGTKIIPTDAATPPTRYFRLACFPRDGSATVEKTVTVSVQ